MKNKVYKLIAVIIILTTLFNAFIPLKVFAAASASISAENKNIKTGETTTITVSVSGTEAYELNVTSNGGTLTGETSKALAFDGEQSTTAFTVKFQANSAGTYTIVLSGTVASSEDVNNLKTNNVTDSVEIIVSNPEPQAPTENTTQGESTNNNTQEQPVENVLQEEPPVQEPEEEPKSKNNHLSSLTVSDGVRNLSLKQTRTGSTGFNRDVEDYTVEFEEGYDFDNLEVLKVSASKEDDKASISGAGNYTINEGDNSLEVKCTAEDGSVRTYRIRVTKPIVINKSELKLDSLAITQLNEDGEKTPIILDKLFDAETYEYQGELDDDVESVFVKLTAPKVKDKDIIVKINGKDITRNSEGDLAEEEIKLSNGKNTIRITLISPLDETVTTDYVVTINKEAKALASVNETNGSLKGKLSNSPIVIIGIILGIIVLLGGTLVVLLIINHKRNKFDTEHEDIEELEGEMPKIKNADESDSYLDDSKLDKLNEKYSSEVEETQKDEEKVEEEDKEYDSNVKDKDDLLEQLTKAKEEVQEEKSSQEEPKEEKLFSKDEYLNDIKNKRGRHF